MKGPWIKVIEPDQASGRLKEVYDETIKKRGQLAAIHKIHSLNPESLVGHMGLYLMLLSLGVQLEGTEQRKEYKY